MSIHYRRANVALYAGDCAEVMSSLPAESVDGIVTSPPYAMQRKATYGGIPEADYPEWTVRWMSEARRVLKLGGSIIINIAPHVKNGQISDYVLRTRLALREDGWAELGELIWHKTNAVPAKPLARPRRSWESLLWYGKHGKAWSDPLRNGGSSGRSTAIGQSGSQARNPDWDINRISGTNKTPKVARQTDVYTSSLGSERTNHPAPFPSALAEWCGNLIMPPGGTILDPFSGSASTGIAALRNGWNYIGIDSSEEYVSMSARRLEAAQLDGKENPNIGEA